MPRPRKTHCPRGHEYTEENTRKRGNRISCKACEKIYQTQYMKDHPEKNRVRVKAHKAKIRKFIRDLKEGLKCSRCPESFWGCLDFHHRNPKEKEFEIREAPYAAPSIERILKEIAKCDVLCANCHRKEHFKCGF